MNVSVVFPKRISQAMINELMTIKKGDYFESIAMTRTTSAFVIIIGWILSLIFLICASNDNESSENKTEETKQ
ncbi:MAG: hypothetical protein K5681_02925 [Treponema sp.]|nr:hypothetical protein [Treponema sp.]